MRSSNRSRRNAGLGSLANCQASTSGSSRLHRAGSVTRVPALGRLSTSPLAERMRNASRSADRDRSRWWLNSLRSEEGGVGKDGVITCRSRWAPVHEKKKKKVNKLQ